VAFAAQAGASLAKFTRNGMLKARAAVMERQR
jgi:hypothetical protein